MASARHMSVFGRTAKDLAERGLLEEEPEGLPKRGFRVVSEGRVVTYRLTPEGREVLEAARAAGRRWPYLQ